MNQVIEWLIQLIQASNIPSITIPLNCTWHTTLHKVSTPTPPPLCAQWTLFNHFDIDMFFIFLFFWNHNIIWYFELMCWSLYVGLNVGKKGLLWYSDKLCKLSQQVVLSHGVLFTVWETIRQLLYQKKIKKI